MFVLKWSKIIRIVLRQFSFLCGLMAVMSHLGMGDLDKDPAVSRHRESPMRQLVTFANSPIEPDWIAVNDGVMGGRSSGGPTVVDGMLSFRGELSLANNGGFSSVRSVDRTFDLSDVVAVVLRVRGDGRRYQLRLATEARYRGMAVS